MFSSNAAVQPALQHDIDQLHEEALEMNGLFNSAAFRFNHFWGSLDHAARSEAVEKAHAEALAMAANYASADQMANEFLIEQAHAEALEINAEVDRRRALSVERTRRNEFHELTKGQQSRIISQCHAEALEIEAARKLNARQARFVFHNTAAERAEAIEAAHAEALEMNAQYDLGVAMAADHNAQLVFSRQSDAAKYGLIELAHLEALHLNRLMDLPIADPGRLLAYILWRNKARAAGYQLVKFACPHCETDFHALAPEIGEASDTFCTCPVCASVFFRIVDNENGKPVVSVHAVENSAEGASHA